MTEDEASTFYQGIVRLPPAHTLTLVASTIPYDVTGSLTLSMKSLQSDEE
jgi:hypothetical protein